MVSKLLKITQQSTGSWIWPLRMAWIWPLQMVGMLKKAIIRGESTHDAPVAEEIKQ